MKKWKIEVSENDKYRLIIAAILVGIMILIPIYVYKNRLTKEKCEKSREKYQSYPGAYDRVINEWQIIYCYEDFGIKIK